MSRAAQSSRLRARVDVFFRLIDDPDGQLIGLQNCPMSSVEIVRNRPSECDTASVSLARDALPFDLRVIADKSMFVSVWLFEGQDPARCIDGQEGQFFGVVDDVSRGRYEGDVQLSCRDMTAVPLQAFMPEALVKSFEIERSMTLIAVVEALIAQIPGTRVWTVRTLGRAALRSATLPILQPAASTAGTGRSPKVSTAQGKAHLADITDPGRLSVWSAITNVCARAGIVPEVRFGAGGSPEVVLVSASDLQASDVLRPFGRGGRKWRVFVDGDGLASLQEKLDLAGGEGRPDFVEVGTRLANGLQASARWPERSGSKDEKNDAGMFQFVAGVASQAALQDMARAGYESLAHNQYRASLTVTEPWSDGGGPSSPDLLSLGYGAVVEVATPNFERFAAGRSATQVLEGRGLTPELAAKVASAQSRLGALSLLFQCAEVRHSWGAQGYRCEIGVRQFLGRASLPLLQSGAPVDRLGRLAAPEVL